MRTILLFPLTDYEIEILKVQHCTIKTHRVWMTTDWLDFGLHVFKSTALFPITSAVISARPVEMVYFIELLAININYYLTESIVYLS